MSRGKECPSAVAGLPRIRGRAAACLLVLPASRILSRWLAAALLTPFWRLGYFGLLLIPLCLYAIDWMILRRTAEWMRGSRRLFRGMIALLGLLKLAGIAPLLPRMFEPNPFLPLILIPLGADILIRMMLGWIASRRLPPDSAKETELSR